MLVSVCTITYNRRAFIPSLIRCFQEQDYKGKMEWVIVDDGTDPIGDLVESLPCVNYIRIEKTPLGKKRNIMHSHCSGDILVYMDDDDYYPPTRVSHAVKSLLCSPLLCAGSSVMFIYYQLSGRMIRCSPYGPNHATAGTFAFKRHLLTLTSYEDEATVSEEKHFLKNYTIPMIQLDPFKTILVMAHATNTYDKTKIIETPSPFVLEVNMTLEEWIYQLR